MWSTLRCGTRARGGRVCLNGSDWKILCLTWVGLGDGNTFRCRVSSFEARKWRTGVALRVKSLDLDSLCGLRQRSIVEGVTLGDREPVVALFELKLLKVLLSL